jgi:hypothetical protein
VPERVDEAEHAKEQAEDVQKKLEKDLKEGGSVAALVAYGLPEPNPFTATSILSPSLTNSISSFVGPGKGSTIGRFRHRSEVDGQVKTLPSRPRAHVAGQRRNLRNG